MIESRALMLSQDLVLSLGRREYPEPDVDHAVIEVEWAGLCGSDLHVLRTGDWVRDWPATPGHEIVGVVLSCPGAQFAPGTRVVVDSRVSCQACAGCLRAANRCEKLAWVGEAFPGGFQERLVAPVRLLVEVPQELESELAVLAEPLAVAIHATRKWRESGDTALIIGYGPIGQLVHAELDRKQPGIQVYVIEPDPARSQIAYAFGAELTTPAHPAVVFESSGHPTALAQALSLVDGGGEIVVVALGHVSESLIPAAIAEKGVSIHGANGFDNEFGVALGRLRDNPERFRALITDAHPLEDAPAVLGAALSHPVPGKLVFRP